MLYTERFWGVYFMRKFLISAVIVGLIGGTSLAVAQDQDHHPGGGEPHGGPGGAPHVAPHAASAHAAPAARGGPAMSRERTSEHHDVRQARPAAAPAAPNATRGGNNNAMRGNPRPAPNNAMRGNPGQRPSSNNAMRGNAGSHHDFSSVHNFHQNFTATRRFHGPAYRQPPGYYSQRWTWGQTLPAAFWARDYWLTDFGAYDLPPPPFGAVWVRVGSDALLIDQESGQIIEVDYGVFY
jgi:Ni/Co efflux regulator RcnB